SLKDYDELAEKLFSSLEEINSYYTKENITGLLQSDEIILPRIAFTVVFLDIFPKTFYKIISGFLNRDRSTLYNYMDNYNASLSKLGSRSKTSIDLDNLLCKLRGKIVTFYADK